MYGLNSQESHSGLWLVEPDTGRQGERMVLDAVHTTKVITL